MKLTSHKKIVISLSSAVIFLAISIWFYISYAPNPTLPTILLPKHAGFTIEAPEKVNLNQPFKIKVLVNTNQNTINAVGLNIKYEGEKIKIISLDTTQSFCQFYPEKKFNDDLGQVTLSCGSPSPGFSGENTVVTLEAIPVKIGTTSVIIDKTSKILKSDGKGTNLISEFPQHAINIINSL